MSVRMHSKQKANAQERFCKREGQKLKTHVSASGTAVCNSGLQMPPANLLHALEGWQGGKTTHGTMLSVQNQSSDCLWVFQHQNVNFLACRTKHTLHSSATFALPFEVGASFRPQINASTLP